ncbi:MAG: hypothetical protein ABFD69_11595 [Candidatus Sumerlaeia bacterium]
MSLPQSIRALWLSLFIAFAPNSRAADEISIRILAQVDGGKPSVQSLVETTLGSTVLLHALIQCGRGGDAEYFSDFAGRADLAGRDINVKTWTGAPIAWRWYKVEPFMMHTGRGHDPTVPSFLWYTNAYVPGSPKMSQGWIGFDTIQYAENAVTTDSWSITADAHPTDRRYDFGGGMGVMRYKLAARIDGKLHMTPGAEATDYLGIEPKVFRVGIRRDDTLLGHALGFFNVPGIFGSHDLQVERRIGVDCADLMVGAWRSKTGQKMPYTNVNGLIAQMKPVGGVWDLTREGGLTPEKPNEQPIHCEPGMVVVFDYAGTVRDYYDHIGMLYNVGKDGVLDAHDQMLQCGPTEPRVNKILTQGGTKDRPTRVRVYRWK